MLGENEHAIKRFKEALGLVNAIFDAQPVLRDSTNRGLLAALAYYQLKSPLSVQSFVRWVVDNNIYLIADSSTPDLIAIFDRVLESRKRTIFVSMPFGKPKPNDHYALIERVARELSEAGGLQPHLRLSELIGLSMGHPM